MDVRDIEHYCTDDFELSIRTQEEAGNFRDAGTFAGTFGTLVLTVHNFIREFQRVGLVERSETRQTTCSKNLKIVADETCVWMKS